MKFYSEAVWEEIPSFPVLCRRRTGAYGPENHRLMEAFKQWVREQGLEMEPIYAMAMDDPAVTAPCQCRYDVCIPKPENWQPDQNTALCRELEGGWYAVFVIPHTVQGVQTAWHQCFAELGRLGGVLDRTRSVMERYQVHLVNAHQCELCLPVRGRPSDPQPGTLTEES